MKVRLFRSEKEPELFAYTSEQTGANLPSEFAPWIQTPTGPAREAGSQSSKNGNGIGAAIAEAVIRDGFCLTCSRSTSERLGLDAHSIH
jgi:hypothetical protein